MEHMSRKFKKEEALTRLHVESTYEKKLKERQERRKKIQEELNKVVKDPF